MKKKTILLLSILLIFAVLYAQNFNNVQIFIYDNDNQLYFSNPDNPAQQIGYEYNLVKAFEDLGFVLGDNLIVDNTLPAYPDIHDYAAVFIVAGHSDPKTEILKPEDVEVLRNYMEPDTTKYNPGCVYLEGNNVMEFLEVEYPDFLHYNFGMKYTGSASSYGGYDTIRVDTSFQFMPPYEFGYPAYTEPDLGIDYFEKYDPANPYTHIATVYQPKQKVYKSTSGCTTPYLPDKADTVTWKSYISAVSMGAMSEPNNNQKALPDSTENRLARAGYLRDILRIFSIGRFFVINHSGSKLPEDIYKAMAVLEIDYEKADIPPGDKLPSYEVLSMYQGVILFTGMRYADGLLYAEDLDNMIYYMNYGGNMIMSGENLATAVYSIKPDILYNYYGVDFQGTNLNDNTHIAVKGSMYAKTVGEFKVETVNEPDFFWPADTALVDGTPAPAFEFPPTQKATYNSGVTFEALDHRTAFFSFPISYMEQHNLVDLLGTTTDSLFRMDRRFEPSYTSVNQLNVNYSISPAGIAFTVMIAQPRTGYLTLSRNSEEMDRQNTSEFTTKYKLNSSQSSGFYTIDYIVNNTTKRSFIFNIPSQASDVYVYLMNDILYIESASDYHSVSVYDIAGNLRMEKALAVEGSAELKGFSEMASGIYFVQLEGSSKKTVRRIMKY
ncbi:MAG: T9SS type A sorting domain-containing protein [bacterium]